MVLKSEIEVGAEYALREPPKRGVEFQRVRVLEQTRSQWKVEWVEPNRGLVDFVKSMNLVAPWRERRAFLREEENWAQLKEACSDWPGHLHPQRGRSILFSPPPVKSRYGSTTRVLFQDHPMPSNVFRPAQHSAFQRNCPASWIVGTNNTIHSPLALISPGRSRRRNRRPFCSKSNPKRGRWRSRPESRVTPTSFR